MDGENLATELPRSSEWDVYKDVFAPPQRTRRTKPWDREPVSAHAPRLNGQRIWKKAGSKVKGHGSKGNDDNAQAELDREGMGARKKLKGTGEKENISNATWLLNSGKLYENEIEDLGSLSPVKKAGNNFESDALLVPRKRTNANHLITPKKSIKKVPLQDVTEKSINDIPIPEELAATANGSLSPAKKPARRTKSIRKSFRRLSRYDSADDIPDIQVHAVVADLGSSTLEALPSEPGQELVSSQPVDIFGTSSEADADAQSNVEVIEVKEQPGVCIDETSGAGGLFQEDGADVVNIEELSGTQQTDILPTVCEESTGEEATLVDGEILQHDSTSVFLQNPSTNIDLSIATKASETPRKQPVKSRSSRTPRTSPVKRRARVTRSSSLIPEAESAKKVQEMTSLNEASIEVQSPCKVQRTPQPRPTNIIQSTVTKDEMSTQPAEADFNLTETSQQLTATSAPVQSQDDVPNQSLLQINETDDIQRVVDIEARNPLNFDLPKPAESVDYLAMETSLALESTVDFDLHTPELPAHHLDKNETVLPITNDSHSLASDDILEKPENLEAFEAITPDLRAAETLSDEADTFMPAASTTTPTTDDPSAAVYNRDDTDLLRNFLTRVNANKAAKASKSIPKRKRSLPHSPIQLPLGTAPTTSPLSSPKATDDKDEFDVSLPAISPNKRRKIEERPTDEDEFTQPRTTRRSGRTRLPVKSAPLAAPSFIPLRRLGGQDGDNTVTLRRDADKELATLTKFNTRKNKGGASLPPIVLAKKAEEKDDPAAKHKALKETFDEMATGKKGKNKKGRNVVWAEEIAQFQSATVEAEPEPILPPAKEEKKVAAMTAKAEDKKPVKVGMRSKIALGMATNGTPAPKRQLKPRKK